MTSLTDRYVAAVLRSVPTGQAAEIELELRAAIADAEQQHDEFAALTALGEPSRLAASFSERPLQLIGPALFLDYRRILSVLLTTALPLIFLATAITAFRTDEGVPAAIAAAASATLLVGMHMVIWCTLVFAVLERSRAVNGRRREWTAAALREIPAKRIDLGSVIGGSVLTAAIAGALIVVQGSGLGPIEPAWWSSGALVFVVVFAAIAIGFDIAGYYVGWALPQAFASLGLSVLFTAFIVALVRGGLLNPAFFDTIGWPGGREIVGWVIIAVITLLGLVHVLGAFRRARPPITTSEK